MNRTKRKDKTPAFPTKKSRAIISIFLVVAILIAGAYAFLTATDSKTNVFTIGKIDIELWEKFDTNTNGTIDDGETYDASTKTPSTVENIVPGQEILKEPYVVNKSTNSCTLFMAVSIPTISSDEAFVDNNSSLTIEGDKKIEVKAFAFQEGYNEVYDYIQIWDSYFEKNSSVFGETCDVNRVNVFNINGVDTDSWELFQRVSTKNESNEYFCTYIYVYRGTFTENVGFSWLLDPGATTSSLFTSVSVNGQIGEKITQTNSLTGTTTTFINTQVTDESIYITDPELPIEESSFPAHNSYWLTGGLQWSDTVDSNYWNIIEIGRHLNTLGANINFSFDSIDSVDYGSYEAYVEAQKNAAQAILQETDVWGIKNSDDGYGTGSKIVTFSPVSGDEILYNVIIYGDLNGDGAITADDATLLQQALDGTITLTTAQKIAADISRDEGVGLSNKDYVPKLTQEDYDALQTVINGEMTPDNQKKAAINQVTGKVIYVDIVPI